VLVGEADRDAGPEVRPEVRRRRLQPRPIEIEWREIEEPEKAETQEPE
jgi:hypothetical protein